MNARSSSLPPVPASPLGRGFAQLHALHGSAFTRESPFGAAPFRHSQFLRVLTATLACPSFGGTLPTAQPATVRSHGSSSNKRGPEACPMTPANAMEAGTIPNGGGNG